MFSNFIWMNLILLATAVSNKIETRHWNYILHFYNRSKNFNYIQISIIVSEYDRKYLPYWFQFITSHFWVPKFLCICFSKLYKKKNDYNTWMDIKQYHLIVFPNKVFLRPKECGWTSQLFRPKTATKKLS